MQNRKNIKEEMPGAKQVDQYLEGKRWIWCQDRIMGFKTFHWYCFMQILLDYHQLCQG